MTDDETRNGHSVLLTVSDTGTGMAPDVLDRAFEPFYTTKPVGQGSGLGLSQVYGFVNQSNGHIDIDSKPGQGTSVHMYLPRAQPTESQPARRPIHSRPSPPPRSARQDNEHAGNTAGPDRRR